jgi:DNA-binding NtrC family response regulator
MRNAGEDKEKTARVLLAVSDAAHAVALGRYLEVDGYELERCHDTRGVLRMVGRTQFDVIVLDLDLGDEGDVEVVSFIRTRNPDAQLILLFELTKLEKAIDGIRQGAFFYLPKGSNASDIALVVGKAVRALEASAAINEYEQSLFEDLVGGSPVMKRVAEVVTKVAPTDSTVLLLGESGTGKELMANTIHRLSSRHDKPFIAINCAALPEQLLESEMFGHVKGAFTGAETDKRGLFEEADGGTILLDEIGEMSLITQAKLLRTLQNGEIRRVGSSTPELVDVRVIAATNRDLEQAVAEREFREDLYFRLNVIQIRIPPLRERMDALPRLVEHFVRQSGAKFGKRPRELDQHAEVLLRNYHYPGNIRELESIIAHAVIMCDGKVIRAQDLPDHVRAGLQPPRALPNYSADSIPSLNEMEDQLIRTALERFDGNQTEVARKLGISRSTLWRKMKEYGISTG